MINQNSRSEGRLFCCFAAEPTGDSAGVPKRERSERSGLACFAPTNRMNCHCEERSDVAISQGTGGHAGPPLQKTMSAQYRYGFAHLDESSAPKLKNLM